MRPKLEADRQSEALDQGRPRQQSALPGRGGFARIAAAFWNSLGGLQEGIATESAIKQEVAIACLLVPLSFFVAKRCVDLGGADREPAIRAVGRVHEHGDRAAVQSHPARPA